MDNRRRQSGESQARHPAAECLGIRSFLFMVDHSALLSLIEIGFRIHCVTPKSMPSQSLPR
jgi:hypothetical protein